MEAAAKTVEVLTQRILPEKPHHLSFHPEWRHQTKPGDGKRFEEWHNPRLQYLTLVSAADRGVLLTRSYYDMREEPVKPPSREVNALAKGGEKKKLSLSDYKNKKTGATPTSPPEPSVIKKRESERAADAPAAPSECTSASEPKPASEARKPDRPRAREPDPPVDDKRRRSREPALDTRLSLKLPAKHPLPPRPPSPARKRLSDLDEEPRPQKRSKPDASRSADDRPQLPREDAQRRRDKAPGAVSRDPPLHRDDRSAAATNSSAASALPNGRAIMKAASASGRNASPGLRPRGDSANGARPLLAGTNRAGLAKTDVSKSSLPPLLSPLHLSFDDRDADDASLTRREKKRREEARDGTRSPKHSKPEASSGNRRQRSPAKIPPLLSPTLPPAVEAALQLGKKSSLEPLNRKWKAKDKYKDERQSVSRRKKPQAECSDDEEPTHKAQRKALIVTLKVPKKLRQTFRRIQALSQSSSRKEIPAEEPATRPAPARKRPVAAVDAASEGAALKKPRTSDITSASRLPAPSTPSKKGPAAMSRVSSSNSLAQTPGDTLNATPSASNTADRRSNGLEVLRPEMPEARSMRDKEMRFSILGRRLKHDADTQMMMMGGHRSPGGASGTNREPNTKLSYVLSLESLLAFMAGFQAQNLYRGLCSKRSDPAGWASLFPFMEFLQKDIRRHESQSRRYLPLYSLLLLLHVTAIDELIKCYAALETPAIALADLLRFERARTRAWPQIRETNAMIEDSGLRVDIAPWASLDEITLSSIRIMRHWCADEDVDWVPDASLKEPVAPRNLQGQNTRA